MQLTDPGTIAWIRPLRGIGRSTLRPLSGGFVALLVVGSVIAFTFWYTSDDQTEI